MIPYPPVDIISSPGAMDCAGEDAREAIESAVGAATDAEINLRLEDFMRYTTSWWFFPTHLTNMLVKLDHETPSFGVKIKPCLKPLPRPSLNMSCFFFGGMLLRE